MKQVSIIIVTYNPDLEKLKRTIKSALLQKEIEAEIIIADDASKDDFREQIQRFMKSQDFEDYKFLRQTKNVGTVKNLYDGISAASGEYIYAISPGDYLYSDDTIEKLYMFSVKNKYNIVYGDAVYYKLYDEQTEKLDLVNEHRNYPYDFKIMEKPNRLCLDKLLFFDNNIMGATYFRKREYAIKYIGEFLDVVTYLEDFSSLAYALAEKEPVIHYDGYVIWYEYGDGVSTNKSQKWKDLLLNDRKNAVKHLANKYLNDNRLNKIFTLKYLSSKSEKIKYIFCGNLWLLGELLATKFFTKRKKEKIHRLPIDYSMMNLLFTYRNKRI